MISDPNGFYELSLDVVDWATQKGIFAAGNIEKQKDKFLEEAQEYHDEQDYDKAKMELGDVLVTVIVNATIRDMDLNECLEMALSKISSRNGKLVDGVFVKEEDDEGYNVSLAASK